MYQEIVEKKAVLDRRRPFSIEVNKQIHHMNRAEMIFSALKFEGSDLQREDIDKIMDGILIKEASIYDYTFIRNYNKLLSMMDNSLEMGNQLTNDLMLFFYRVFTDDDEGTFRRASAMIDAYRYVPIHPSEIELNLSHLFTKLYRGEGNPFFKAAHLHNYVIMIYPFEKYSELFARFAMNYYLREEGYPSVALGYGREEYMQLLKDLLKKEDHAPICNGLQRAAYNKMKVLLQMTEEE